MSNNRIDSRAVQLGEYIVENRATVRSAAKRFGISKSTVHADVTKPCGWCGWLGNNILEGQKRGFLPFFRSTETVNAHYQY